MGQHPHRGGGIKEAIAYLLNNGVLSGLEVFFGSPAVQVQIGAALAGTVNVVLGQITPDFVTTPPPEMPALATYAGELIATALLGRATPASRRSPRSSRPMWPTSWPVSPIR